jgi:PAS domain S-box-containing protein
METESSRKQSKSQAEEFKTVRAKLKQTEQTLKEIEDKYRAILEQTADLQETLKAEQKRLYDVLETIPVMVCLLTPDYHVPFANRSFREKFGEANGRRCYEYCFGRSEPCDFCETYNVLKTGKPHHWEVTSPDGRSIIDVYDFPFTDIDGSPLILEMDIDITESKKREKLLVDSNLQLQETSQKLLNAKQELERKNLALEKAQKELEKRVEERTVEFTKSNALLKQEIFERKMGEEVLQETNELMEKIFSNTYLCIAYMDTNFNFIRVNHAYAESDGRNEKFFIGKNLFEIYPNEENEAIFQRVVEIGEPYVAYAKPFVYAGHPERGVTYWDWTLHPVKDSHEKIDGLLLCLVNVTERKRLEKEILAVIEKERIQIGRELHDSMGQILTGLAVKSKGLELKLKDKSLDEAKEVAKISKLASKLITQTRSLVKTIHPIDLEAGGITSALQTLASNTEKLLGPSCHFKCDEPVVLNDPVKARQIYRIAQEAITNAVKHGKAKNVSIELTSDKDKYILSVKNDGKNFPKVLTKAKGFGLKIMEYRSSMIGGQIDIRKDNKGGTIVTCVFPKAET